MKNLLLPIVTLLALSTASAADTVIEIQAIAGKLKDEVNAVIGKPTACTNSKYGERCAYAHGVSEIVFIKEKADWITVDMPDNMPFGHDALAALGLPTTKPTFENAFNIRWEHIQGLLEVTVFSDGSKTDYAYIKVVTK